MDDIQPRDKELWETARERAGFRAHFITYFLVNLLLWIIWGFVAYVINEGPTEQFPWPIFPLLGWGIGLVFHYMQVYRWKKKWTEKEYQKLIKQKETTNTNA